AIQITAKISLKNSWCSEQTFTRIIDAMKKNNLFVDFGAFKTETIAKNIVTSHEIELNVITEIGKCETKKVNLDDFRN
ncbi:MAG: hypothetical protein IJ597_04290, partial [Synergistaceae bacterium]|nr:hypothetical protein [Synergistaceae bacterium]